jgi:hypothetical protein
MWLISAVGFYSIVQKHWDVGANTLTVRSRVRKDLEDLRDRYLPTLGSVQEDRHADYRYRVQVPAAEVAAAAARIAADIDYNNFKHAVEVRQGIGRARLYADAWAVLHRLQISDTVAGPDRQ